MSGKMPFEVRDMICDFAEAGLKDRIKQDISWYKQLCDGYCRDYNAFISDLRRYSNEEDWIQRNTVSVMWKREGRELRKLIVTYAKRIRWYCAVRLPRGVYYHEFPEEE
jgi:hypothetical protein